ncbi:hypothetical protein BH20ACI4_BH20ACI4_03580 [soil metagenome]
MNIKSLILIIAVLMVVVGVTVCSSVVSSDDVIVENESPDVETIESNLTSKPKKTLKAFRSQKELNDFLRQIAERQKSRRSEKAKTANSPSASNSAVTTDGLSAESKDDESVTNTQHVGVDEGGIVKLHGDYLIILRRGRLFTVAINDNSLKPISTIDAFAPDIDPNGTWYDEMLISGNTIAVIGYSYQRGGTEIGLFKIDEQGKLRYRSTFHLRSNDYYSSRNYASRLIGGKLIFYTPQYLWFNGEDPTAQFPAIRKWRKGATNDEFQIITSPTRVYRPANEINSDYETALHTVTLCDLESAEFSCKATAVVGPAGRVFYVSPESVYVWVTDWRNQNNESRQRSTLYQMPLDGSAPSALGVSGSPVDQFSFLESNDGYLNVLVRSEANGDGMWRAETTAGDVALLRVPRNSFSDGSDNASSSYYTTLPKVEGYTFQNRYVGDYLLYGTGNSWNYPKDKKRSNLYAVRWATGETKSLSLEHTVDRIEAMGKDAVVVGTKENNLYFSPVSLNGNPRVFSSYVRKNAAQGELRSHGFFYKPQDSNSGLLGLPIRDGGSPGYENLYENSASVLFLRNNFLNFREIGTLEARPKKQLDDGCRASCVDWYGNARPLFIRGRIFALLGYEIVEGTMADNGISEKRRASFAPNSRYGE